MIKYLYLTKPEWALTWVNGGRVPLNLASIYKRMDREGIYTPDENLIYESKHDLSLFEPAISIGNVKGLSIGEVTINGRSVAKNIHVNKYFDDGVIISLCNRKSKSVARRLQKAACVRIYDVFELKNVIDEQLGVEGVAESCSYTDGHERNHFLKSTEDSWQDEFRIFWALPSSIEVCIPKGIAKQIKL